MMRSWPAPLVRDCSYKQFSDGLRDEHFLLFKLHALLTSAPLAWLLYRYGWSANAVTILAMALCLPAALANATAHYYWAIAVFHVFFLLDGADGVLARATETTSVTGAYLDDLAHYVFHSLFFISLGGGLALAGHTMGGVLALATGLSSNLQRAHLDLIKIHNTARPVNQVGVGHVSAGRKLMHCFLRSFDFPNILVVMTFLTWRVTLLEWYFAYCVFMNFLYLAYCSTRHASQLSEVRPRYKAAP
jgi:phosphatidylglycerophosphate synthase